MFGRKLGWATAKRLNKTISNNFVHPLADNNGNEGQHHSRAKNCSSLAANMGPAVRCRRHSDPLGPQSALGELQTTCFKLLKRRYSLPPLLSFARCLTFRASLFCSLMFVFCFFLSFERFFHAEFFSQPLSSALALARSWIALVRPLWQPQPQLLRKSSCVTLPFFTLRDCLKHIANGTTFLHATKTQLSMSMSAAGFVLMFWDLRYK